MSDRTVEIQYIDGLALSLGPSDGGVERAAWASRKRRPFSTIPCP
jgi:hypothetical protein